MAVRRLHPDQPPSFAFSPENLAWAKETIAKYPPGKEASAVLPVLWRAQEQNDGWLPEPAIRYVAEMLGMAYIRVYEVATFYTMFQLAPVGKKAHVQVCGTTPCMLRGAEDLIKVCKSKINHEPHHLSADGDFSWEEVECLGSCANAPMVQIFKDTYEDLTPELFEKLLEGFAKGNPPKPGSMIGRTASCPEGGLTSLTDPALFDGSGIGAWKKRFAETTGAAPDAKAPAASAPATPAAVPAAPVTKENLAAEAASGAVAAARGTAAGKRPKE
ncbi:MAG: NADH-quinone oxidoreductase subunit NuoE [Hyphomicrobiaceae bacterium]|nr:NADH-quinone oxidoreductase subunit NuoE [Hyphomicrobiaceae bacterium]